MVQALKQVKSLQKVLNYSFKNEKLFSLALSHAAISKAEDKLAFQRLEFLGDAVLGLVQSQDLFDKYSEFTAGQLSDAKNAKVSNHALIKMAKKINLESYISIDDNIFGKKVLADHMEAVFGAVFVDSHYNYEETEKVISNVYKKVDWQEEIKTNFKSKLNNLTQETPNLSGVVYHHSLNPNSSKLLTLPFQAKASVTYQGKEYFAIGKLSETKRLAEQSGAEKLLKILEKKI